MMQIRAGYTAGYNNNNNIITVLTTKTLQIHFEQGGTEAIFTYTINLKCKIYFK